MTRTLRAVLVTLGDPLQLTGGYLFHRRLVERAAAHAATLDFVSLPDRRFPLGLLDAPRVCAQIDQQSPDVVVVDSIIAWCLAFASPRTPAVGMLHQPPGGIDFGPPRSTVQAGLDRLAYRHLRRLMVASESLADDLRRQGIDPARLRVVPPGRDVASEIDQVPDDLRRDRLASFVCVGNWVARKGILSLLEAFAALEPRAATLHLVGRTAVEPAYARRVWARLARPDLVSRVVVHGPVSIGEVAAMYAAADAFVLPSLKEPYGTVYGEAMAFGLPVVGWRAGNLPYLADHEREGLLVEPGDITGLSAALARLAHDPDLRRQLGTAAHQRAMQRPDWDAVAEMFFAQLRAVAQSG
ncbi:MAG: glycosyltransferase family 4 protein [Chloroflexi bacterium]|nr:glycosyltransferase family 4 protein [Chloroflexota bacterium]